MPLHSADPAAEVTMPDGRVIRNLTDEEYRATLIDALVEGGPEQPKIPSDVLAAAVARCEG